MGYQSLVSALNHTLVVDNFTITRLQMHVFFDLPTPVLEFIIQIHLYIMLNYECMRLFIILLLLTKD